MTVLDAHGLGGILSKVPLFIDFINFLGEHKDYNKTIFFTIPENSLDDIVSKIEEITGELDKHSGAMIIALDIAYYKGSMEAI